MFDEVRCYATLPDDGEPADFQSKSMDCTMATYIITTDGRLTKREWEETSAEPCDHTGEIEFYAGSRCYRAVFVAGRLAAILSI
jgi:hypothetical protein